MRGARNHHEAAARKESNGLLGPALRDDRIWCSPDNEGRRLWPRQLVLDAIGERVAKRREDAPDAGVPVILPDDRSERRPRARRFEWRVERPAQDLSRRAACARIHGGALQHGAE